VEAQGVRTTIVINLRAFVILIFIPKVFDRCLVFEYGLLRNCNILGDRVLTRNAAVLEEGRVFVLTRQSTVVAKEILEVGVRGRPV